jgi:hypothetical protein
MVLYLKSSPEGQSNVFSFQSIPEGQNNVYFLFRVNSWKSD